MRLPPFSAGPGQSSSSSPQCQPYHASSSHTGRISIPHRFFLHSYTRPTVCQFCKKLLKGLFKQGVQCRDCQYNAHKKCVEKVPKDCVGDMATGS